MPFAHCRAFGNDDAVGLFLRAAHVWFQFGAVHLAVAVDGVYLAVVIEQHAQVVYLSLHVMVLPRTADVFGCIALKTLAVHIAEHVELTVGIADARCPDAAAVYLLAVFQREGIVGEIEAVKAVGNILPVHQVARVQDDQPRNAVHGGAGQIVVVAHAQDVRVGKLVVEQRVGKCAVAVVG